MYTAAHNAPHDPPAEAVDGLDVLGSPGVSKERKYHRTPVVSLTPPALSHHTNPPLQAPNLVDADRFTPTIAIAAAAVFLREAFPSVIAAMM